MGKGGFWLLEETQPDAVFTPEKLTDEHRMMARTARDFVFNEVLPNLEHLENKEWDLSRRLVHRCGELGLLGTDTAEIYESNIETLRRLGRDGWLRLMSGAG